MLLPFDLNLDEYKKLWQPVLYNEQVQLGGIVPPSISQHAVDIGVNFMESDAWWHAANDLRKRCAEHDPVQSRLCLAWMLLLDRGNESESTHYEYALDLMSGGMRGHNDAQAVRNLLDTALASRGYALIEIACLFEAAQICSKHQMALEARRLCTACFVRQKYAAPPDNVRAFYR